MRVLHYFLGWPPARSGGLTQYAVDLMHAEANKGTEVYALFPAYNFFRNFCPLSDLKNKYDSKVITFSLNNSEPLPLKGSISSPKDFMKPGNIIAYLNFLKDLHPEIFHIHTIMGLPREFLLACKQLGIKIVFTTHDYFGISPNPKFIFDGKDFSCKNSTETWLACSTDSASVTKLRLYQNPLYPFVKSTLRTFKRILQKDNIAEKDFTHKSGNNNFHNEDLKSFQVLRNYYLDMLKLIDHYIFNSFVTKDVYLKNLNFNPTFDVVPVTTAEVKLPKKRIVLPMYTSRNILKIGYIGPYTKEKGFDLLVDVVQKIPKSRVKLHIWGDSSFTGVSSGNIFNHGRFEHKTISDVFRTFDLLVIPSVWKETFGLTALEAIANHTPVVISSKAGSSMLVKQLFTFEPTKDGLSQWFVDYCNRAIPNEQFIQVSQSLTSMSEQAEAIQTVYWKVLEK